MHASASYGRPFIVVLLRRDAVGVNGQILLASRQVAQGKNSIEVLAATNWPHWTTSWPFGVSIVCQATIQDQPGRLVFQRNQMSDG